MTTPATRPSQQPETQALNESFRQMVAAVRRLRGRETHSKDGISNAQYQLLFKLRNERQLTGGELADAADLSPATATQMLEALELAGLVSRERSVQDRRKVLTSLTPRGRALVEQRHARFDSMWRQALAGFSDDELQTAGAVMDKLRELFDELAAGDPPD